MVKLFVALPTTHGSMRSRFLSGMMDFYLERPFDAVVSQAIDPYIISARNALAADFLQTDCTHLMFIDADILFNAGHIKRLVSHDVDIVGGLYPKKIETKLQWVCNALPDRPPVDERGLLALRHVGTGFMLINRIVFEAFVEELGDEIGYMEDEIDRQRWAFFWMPIVADEKGIPRLKSEDWHFCDQARALGFKVYGDTKVLLKHIGDAVYPLEHQVKESNARQNYENHRAALRVVDRA
jgi:hypothetical protein